MNMRRLSAYAAALVLVAAGVLVAATPAYANQGVLIFNRGSRKCLTPLNGSSAQGAPIVQEPCIGSFGQHWFFDGMTGQSRRVHNLDTNLCLFASNVANGAPVYQEPCGFIDTNWAMTDLPAEGKLRVLRFTLWGTNTCLDLENGWLDDGVVMQVWSCNLSTNNQKWYAMTVA